MRQSIFHQLLWLYGVAEGIDLSSKRGLAFHGDEHESDNNLLKSNNSEIAWYYTWSQIGRAHV